jgi:hypothetical protein
LQIISTRLTTEKRDTEWEGRRKGRRSCEVNIGRREQRERERDGNGD